MRGFFGDDRGDRGVRGGIVGSQQRALFVQMPKYDAFDRDGGRDDGAAAQQPSDQAQRQSADAAKRIAVATPTRAPLQFRGEQHAMAAFVRVEFVQFGQ